MASEPRHIIIVGGGIIGCSTAYFLTRHPAYDASKHRITILEASSIAGGASGKAGGLLALWAYPKALVPLSFRLHAELAKEHDGGARWGYRRLHVGQLSAAGRAPPTTGKPVHPPNTVDRVSLEKRAGEDAGQLRAAGVPTDLDWFDVGCIRGYDAMGDTDDSAQVHPHQFTRAMASLAGEKGANVIMGRALRIESSEYGVSGVHYIPADDDTAKTLEATDVIVAAGPWTATVLPGAPIAALRAHSVTIRPQKPVSAYAIFTDIALTKGQHVTPEIYARPDGEVYACGEGDRLVPLPDSTANVETDQSRCQAIVDHVGSISDQLRNGTVTARQACYLPNVDTAAQGPLVGRTHVKGLFLAAGHTCWGIQNGPGTGKLMSEFIFDGEAKSAQVKSLDPRLVL